MQKRCEHLLCVKHCSRCWDTAIQTEKVTLRPWVLCPTGEADNDCEENEQGGVRKGSCGTRDGMVIELEGSGRTPGRVASELGGDGALGKAWGREHSKLGSQRSRARKGVGLCEEQKGGQYHKSE